MTFDDEQTEREAQVVRLLDASAQTERAPAALRAQIDEMRARAASRRRRRVPNIGGVAFRYASAATTAVAALAVTLALVLSGGGGLSIAEAAGLATQGASAPAPLPYSAAPSRLLSARVGGLHFPNWSSPQGWHSTGARIDHVGGRTVKTVYYANGSKKLAYSIVSTPTLDGFDSSPGERYATMSKNGRTVVIWEERGHTCVLSASGISAPSLWKLASSTIY